MWRHLYSGLYYLLLPWLLLMLWWKGFKVPAYRLRWQERLGYFAAPEYQRITCSDPHTPSPPCRSHGDDDGLGDGLGDVCDLCPEDADNDLDGDSLCGNVDVCPSIPDPAQDDADEVQNSQVI